MTDLSNADNMNTDNVDSGKARRNKPLDPINEISKRHKVMTSILNRRLLKLKAAETLWHKDVNSVVEYVLRVEDDSLLVDILPLMTKRVKEDSSDRPSLSMGACLELLPRIFNLVDSRYEYYIIVGLDIIREIMKKWWMDLKATSEKEKQELNQDFRCSRSAGGVYMLLISKIDRIKELSKRDGKVGEKAKVVDELMALI